MPSGSLWTMEPADLHFYNLIWFDKMDMFQGNRTVEWKSVVGFSLLAIRVTCA